MTRLDQLRAQANPTTAPSSLDATVDEVNIAALKIVVDAYDTTPQKKASDFLDEEIDQ